MRAFHADTDMTSLHVGVASALVLLLLFLIAFLLRHEDINRLQSAFVRSVKKLQLIQTMSRELLSSAEAEKSAVMAETDEASHAFSEQSIQAAQHVEEARRMLEPLLKGNPQEAQLFREFSQCWERLQAIDREVLSLAVQNTNLKALRLSFVPSAEAIGRLEKALNQLMNSASSSQNAAGITRHAFQATIGAFHIYALQAPHIAESTAVQMDKIEAAMKNHDAQVIDALQNLQVQVDESSNPFLDTAWAAYQDFQKVNAEIIDLSRQNSNIRSFALSLGQKRKTAAQCQDVLAALQEMVHKGMTYKATR